jgi:periplasmic copper chaperone A
VQTGSREFGFAIDKHLLLKLPAIRKIKEQNMKKLLTVVVALIFLLSACGTSAPAGSQGAIEISAPYANAAGAGENSAAYMNFTNTGAEADTLLKASCDAAMMTQVMETKMEGDVMSMSEISRIELPSKNTVGLKPGGYHIMLMGLMQELKEGTTINITLEFANASRITIEVPVKAP